MSWKCWKCTTLCQLTGIVGMAALIATAHGSEISDQMTKVVYKMMKSRYGERITEDEFKKNTQTLLGQMNDFAFMAAYPKKICQWFKQCK